MASWVGVDSGLLWPCDAVDRKEVSTTEGSGKDPGTPGLSIGVGGSGFGTCGPAASLTGDWYNRCQATLYRSFQVNEYSLVSLRRVACLPVMAWRREWELAW